MNHQKSIPAFAPNTPTTRPPDCYILPHEKKQLIDQRRGRAIDHGKHFRFFFATDSKLSDNHTYRQRVQTLITTCDQSAKMGVRVIEANARNEEWAVTITKGWQPGGLDASG